MHKTLVSIDKFLKLAFNSVLNNSLLIVSVTSILFFFFSYQTKSLTQSVSIEDQLDPDMQSSKDLRTLKDLFGSNTSLGFIALPKHGHYFSYPELCKLQEDVNNTAHNNSIISDFISPFKLRYAHFQNKILTYQRVLENPCTGEHATTLNNPVSPLLKTPWISLLTDNQAKDLTFNLSINPKDPPGSYGDFDSDGIEALMKKIESFVPHQLYWTGSLAMQYFTLKGMAQSQWLNFIIIIIIWVSLRIYFGTWRSGAIFLLSLFFSSVLIYGGMAFFHHSIDMLSSCLFLILAVSSLEDFIFVAQHQLENDCSYIESHLELITPSFFTSLTTVLGFGSLITSELLPIRRFGAWAAFGAFIEWVAIFLLVPAFMNRFPSWRSWVNQEKSFSIAKTKKVVKKKPSLLFSRFALIVFILSFFSIKNFRLSQTPSEMFPKNHPYQKMIDYVRGNRNWETEASLFFSHNVPEEKKSEILKIFTNHPIIQKIENHKESYQFLIKEIDDPMAKELVLNEFNHTKFAERYLSSSGDERAIVYLKTTNTQKINELRSKIENFCPAHECWLGGEIVAFADFSKSLIRTLFDSFFISLLLVGLVIFYLAWATKIKNYFSLIIASFWGPAVILCLIYALDLSINFVTCIIASTLVGLTGDNAIQFMFAANNNDLHSGIEERGPSSLYCALTMGLCSLVFLGSYFEAPKILGALLAAGFFFSLIGDVWILSGLSRKNLTFYINHF